ncbi:hypothetical protein GOODEAATRI_030185, partial [Goodea atripinnis]
LLPAITQHPQVDAGKRKRSIQFTIHQSADSKPDSKPPEFQPSPGVPEIKLGLPPDRLPSRGSSTRLGRPPRRQPPNKHLRGSSWSRRQPLDRLLRESSTLHSRPPDRCSEGP